MTHFYLSRSLCFSTLNLTILTRIEEIETESIERGRESHQRKRAREIQKPHRSFENGQKQDLLAGDAHRPGSRPVHRPNEALQTGLASARVTVEAKSAAEYHHFFQFHLISIFSISASLGLSLSRCLIHSSRLRSDKILRTAWMLLACSSILCHRHLFPLFLFFSIKSFPWGFDASVIYLCEMRLRFTIVLFNSL